MHRSLFSGYRVIAIACVLAISGCDSDMFDLQDDASSSESRVSTPVASSATTIVVGTDLHQCVGHNPDPDGDGYGFENGRSCLSNHNDGNQTPICQSALSDPDGDGYGYENNTSCRVVSTGGGNQYNNNRTTYSDRPAPVVDFIDESPVNLSLVTDVILTAGQSNASAQNTRFEPGLHAEDRLDSRIIVWTQNNGWKTANPYTQIWEFGKFPAQPWDSTIASNSPGFQIARAIVDADPNRVVAFIPTSTPGEAIYHWRYGAQAYNNIKQTVETALNQLPHKAQVDLIWWMQGEADAEANDYYRNALANLINNWRGEPWYGPDKYFIANETARFPVNQIFRDLRYDADPYSDYSAGEDLPTTDSVHFATQAYRMIGNRVQQAYFGMLNRTR